MGRRGERDVLDRVIEAVRAGESRALVVSSEPSVRIPGGMKDLGVDLLDLDRWPDQRCLGAKVGVMTSAANPKVRRRRRLAVVLFGWRPHRHAIGAPFDLWVRNPTITGRVAQDELRSEHCYAAFAAGMSVADCVVRVG